MKDLPTQKEMVFYKLYRAFKEDPQRLVAAWEFVGEMHVPELGIWVLMSYKTPANGISIYFENPGLIHREKITGKSGSLYYGYRFVPTVSANLIKDEKLKAFYEKIRTRKQPIETAGTPEPKQAVLVGQ